MVIKWDGVVRDVPEWNKDLTMKEAFRDSSVALFPGNWPTNREGHDATLG